jgi:hypothetical protein
LRKRQINRKRLDNGKRLDNRKRLDNKKISENKKIGKTIGKKQKYRKEGMRRGIINWVEEAIRKRNSPEEGVI